MIRKKIKIGVIGASSSGKSYQLFDMIHAFGALGYKPEELPLSYPHSSFGAFFYDTFNNLTGGMRGTESYACRPERHYGAYLSKSAIGHTLEVDFLNIPGEIFDSEQNRMQMFFDLKDLIEEKREGIFFLSIWKSPSGHTLKLIVPPDFDLSKNEPLAFDSEFRLNNYLSWKHLAHELHSGRYQEVSRKSVSGRQMLRQITEIVTDSLLLTIRDCWSSITQELRLQLRTYDAFRVLLYFYPLMYCQQATDIILCDKLTLNDGVGDLAETVSRYMSKNNTHRPHVYLAFRGADLLLNESTLSNLCEESGNGINRNVFYEKVMEEITTKLNSPVYDGVLTHIPDTLRSRIMQSVGSGLDQAFWQLLNSSITTRNAITRSLRPGRLNLYELSQQAGNNLPPHVYFTSTPIDTELNIYKSDPDDVTRFYSDQGNRLRSFAEETGSGRAQHLCFGTYQLLTDILFQNGIKSEGLEERGEHLTFMQSKL